MWLSCLYAKSLIYILLTFIVVNQMLYISWWFIVDVGSNLGALYYVDVGSVADIQDVGASASHNTMDLHGLLQG
jgi:hypothetical protein